MTQVLSQLPHSVIESLMSTFTELDENKDGYIDLTEIHHALRKSFPDADPEVRAHVASLLLASADTNRDGRVDLTEFETLIFNRCVERENLATDVRSKQCVPLEHLSPAQIEGLMKCFRPEDVPKDGFLGTDELKAALKRSFNTNDDSLIADVAEIIFDTADRNREGKVEINDFVDAFADAFVKHPLQTDNQDTEEKEAKKKQVMAALPQETMEVLRDAFIRLDADGDGYLTRSDLRDAARATLGPRMNVFERYLEGMFIVADADEDDRLDLQEFMASFVEGPGIVPSEVLSDCIAGITVRLTDEEIDKLQGSFHEIDLDGDGFIELDELQLAFSQLWPYLPKESALAIAEKAIEAADRDRDGKLSLSEFIRSYQENQGVLPIEFAGKKEEAVAMSAFDMQPDELRKISEFLITSLDSQTTDYFPEGELRSFLHQTVINVFGPSFSEDRRFRFVEELVALSDRNEEGEIAIRSAVARLLGLAEEQQLSNSVEMTAPGEKESTGFSPSRPKGRGSRIARELTDSAKKQHSFETAAPDKSLYEELFAMLDADHDGFLMPYDGMLWTVMVSEAAKMHPTWTQETRNEAVDRLFFGADHDGDGKLSESEFVDSFIMGHDLISKEGVEELLRRPSPRGSSAAPYGDPADDVHVLLIGEESRRYKKLFRFLDADHDGFISPADPNIFELMYDLLIKRHPSWSANTISSVVDSLFCAADLDEDGKLNEDEFSASFLTGYGILPDDYVEDTMSKLVVALTEEDISRLMNAFNKMDTNHDGFVSREELMTTLEGSLHTIFEGDQRTIAALVDAILRLVDTNQDGRLSFSEFVHSFELDQGILRLPLLAALQKDESQTVEALPEEELQEFSRILCSVKGIRGRFPKNTCASTLSDIICKQEPLQDPDKILRKAQSALLEADVESDGTIDAEKFVACFIGDHPPPKNRHLDKSGKWLRSAPRPEDVAIVRSIVMQLELQSDLVTVEEVDGALCRALATHMEDLELREAIRTAVGSLCETVANEGRQLPVTNLSTRLENENCLVHYLADLSVASASSQRLEQPKPPRTQPAGAQGSTSRRRQLRLQPITQDPLYDDELRVEFAKYDREGKGYLSKAEFKKAYKKLEFFGCPPSDFQIDRMYALYCPGNDDVLDFGSFCVMMLKRAEM